MLTAKIMKVIPIAREEKSVAKKFEAMGANFKSTPTILARDLKIDGTIESPTLIEIEGFVKGKIISNSLIIREEGVVEGEIIADSLSLRGKFSGKINAKNITISSKADIVGEIEYQTLIVEDGAAIDGRFKKIEK